ncbi:MAG TPA: class II aldolase/adducin family protein [Tissierellia bacterium]|mgnify:CR=1 FL=1|nr:class II aldolase/adducin family protein [Tissierellia bacterium]
MDYSEVRKEVVKFCHLLYKKNYTQASGGNVSCRVPGTNLFAIKKTGINMALMTESDVVIVDEDGQVVYGDGKPSKEMGFHLGVLKLRPEANAFIHCHPSYAIALANNDIELPFVTVTSRKVVGYVPYIEPAPAGSDELREFVIKAFKENPESKGILMKEHGICTVGRSLEEAFNIADLIEQTAKQAFIQVQIAANRGLFKEIFNR